LLAETFNGTGHAVGIGEVVVSENSNFHKPIRINESFESTNDAEDYLKLSLVSNRYL
jgi:hypothetical protein